MTVNVRVPPDSAQQAGPGAHSIHFDIALRAEGAAGRDTAGAVASEKSTFVVPR